MGMLLVVSALITFVIAHKKRMAVKQKELEMMNLQHRQKLLESEIIVTEKERENIAKNLHDDVGANLNFIYKNFEIIKANETDKNLVAEIMDESIQLLENTIETSRNIIYDLMPPALLRLGFVYAMKELSSMLNASGEKRIAYIHNLNNQRFSQRNELQLYRITKELLNNIIKHTDATEVKLTIHYDQSLTIHFEYNSDGLTDVRAEMLSHTANGIGLRSIKSRVETLNATIQYSSDTKNSEIKIMVPETVLKETQKKYTNTN